MERVRVGSWHFMKWCFLRLKVVCVCVSGAFVCFCRAGWSPIVRFGSQLGGVLAKIGVLFFDAFGGLRWSACVLGAGIS